jgi:hypothetical protein
MITKQELERALGPLTWSVDGLPKEQAEAAGKVRDLLARVLETAAEQPAEEGRTNRALVALALGVMEARRNGLPDLPMPEYDLWLPFKAGCGLHSKPPGSNAAS